MKKTIHSVTSSYLSSQKFRYLISGVWNTMFGYFCGIVIYYALGDRLGILLVGILSNFLAISMSFLTHKLFVFKTKNNWLKEYLRAYCVYGLSAGIGILLLLVFVKWFDMVFWLAQGAVIMVSIGFSYFGHKTFTFKH